MSSAAKGIRPRAAVKGTPRATPLIAQADDTTWRTLAVFCGYRILLAVLVGVAFVFFNHFFFLGIQARGLVIPTLIAYVVASLVLLAPARIASRTSRCR
jgi:hypothetical protein